MTVRGATADPSQLLVLLPMVLPRTFACACASAHAVSARMWLHGCPHHPADAAGRYIYERGCANGKRVQVGSAACTAKRDAHSMQGPLYCSPVPRLYYQLGQGAASNAPALVPVEPYAASAAVFGSTPPSAQANMGAKNHAVVMPDANVEATTSALVR